jgi:hypothetical protein
MARHLPFLSTVEVDIIKAHLLIKITDTNPHTLLLDLHLPMHTTTHTPKATIPRQLHHQPQLRLSDTAVLTAIPFNTPTARADGKHY